MKINKNSVVSTLVFLGLFVTSSIISIANANTNIEIKKIKGTFVKTPQKMTLKTLNEIFLLEDEGKFLMTAESFDENSMVQAFKVCIRGYAGRNNQNRKIIYVQSLCNN